MPTPVRDVPGRSRERRTLDLPHGGRGPSTRAVTCCCPGCVNGRLGLKTRHASVECGQPKGQLTTQALLGIMSGSEHTFGGLIADYQLINLVRRFGKFPFCQQHRRITQWLKCTFFK